MAKGLRAEVTEVCVCYHPSDEFTLGRWLRSLISAVSDGGAAGVCGAVGRIGNCRYHASPADHTLAVDFEPQVFPNEYPEFGLHGRGGKSTAGMESVSRC